jgi:replicative DNA helicase
MAEVVEIAGEGKAEAALSRAQGSLLKLSEGRKSTKAISVGQIVKDVLADIKQLRANPKKTAGMHTGFHDYDAATGGAFPGELTITAGRPAMGKTALVMGKALGWSAQGYKVGVLSLEMPQKQLALRILSGEVRMAKHQLLGGAPDLTDIDMAILEKAVTKIQDHTIWVDDSGSLAMSKARTIAQRMKLDYGIEIMVIDYIQRMSYPGAGSREQEMSQISNGLKTVAKDLGIHVNGVSSLSRAVEITADKIPTLAHLKDSGDIEAAADLVEFVYRRDYYFPNDRQTGIANIIIAKHRGGPTTTIDLGWNGELTKFYSLARKGQTSF